MTEPERRRLARILGMLGSEHEGERQNAARQAETFRKRHGLTWEGMLSLTPNEAQRPAWAPPEPPPAPPKSGAAPPWPYPAPEPRPIVSSMKEWRAIYAPERKRTKDRVLAVGYFGACAAVLAACLVFAR